MEEWGTGGGSSLNLNDFRAWHCCPHCSHSGDDGSSNAEDKRSIRQDATFVLQESAPGIHNPLHLLNSDDNDVIGMNSKVCLLMNSTTNVHVIHHSPCNRRTLISTH